MGDLATLPRPERVRCPLHILYDLADTAQADLVGRLRRALAVRSPVGREGCAQRVAGYLENGLLLLAGLNGEAELATDQLEACRLLVGQDARFAFIYGVPNSAGFGAAIGAALGDALFGEIREQTCTITALLNVFMTVLDGLLDEVPQIITPHLPDLLDLVQRGAAGEDVTALVVPHDHPYNALCFAIAKLWIGRSCQLMSLGTSVKEKNAFAAAAAQAMTTEYAVCQNRLAAGLPDSDELLYGRTRWPHWTQALVCTLPAGWPQGLDPRAFQEFIFCIADFAAYLDDVCDYVMDCKASRWNTVSYALCRQRPCAGGEAHDIQTHLLLMLADEEQTEAVIHRGLWLRTAIEESLAALDLPTAGFQALIADLTYAYLG